MTPMNKKNEQRPVRTDGHIAQFKPVLWQTIMTHPCRYGLDIFVMYAV